MARRSRRRFLQACAALVIPFFLPEGARLALAQPAARKQASPNAFLRIGKDGLCTVVVKHLEIGQGTTTALPMLVAEELECDWASVRYELAPVGAEYVNLEWGIQGTGGSTGVSNSWTQLRTVGAQARTMLMQAAADQWKVKPSEVRADKGFVLGPGGRKLSYGQLAEAAGRLPVPEKVELKPLADHKVIGKPVRRIDAAGKVNGQAVYGIDVQRKDLHVALVARPPAFGAKPASFKADQVAKVPGVTHVVELPDGIAVVAKSFWAAKQGRDALQVQWEMLPRSRVSTESLAREWRELAKAPGKPVKKPANAEAARGAVKTVVAEYEFPYLAHASMEPLNCTVELHGDSAEIWVGSQQPGVDRDNAARVLGLDPARVTLHSMLAGGGFGRRASPFSDFVVEACHVARQVKVPVKVIWTREDDTRGGHYRPMYVHRVEAGVDAQGRIAGWRHVVVGQSIAADTPFEQQVVKDGIDPLSIEGIAGIAYDIPNLDLTLHSPTTAVPVLWWRSVSHTHTGFVVETMVDELAAAAGKDPLQMRRELLAGKPRVLKVLDLAASRAGWGTALPAGRARGIALVESRRSACAQVAEISLHEGKVRVHRVVAALDCGVAVNPLSVEAQLQSGIAYGLSAALYGKITLKEGRVEQSNFHDYPVVRMDAMPVVEVVLAAGGESPTGVGEVGTPPIAPAVANALFALTGKRARTLPLGDTKWA